MNILEQLADHARERVFEAKRHTPEETVRARALALPKGDFALEKALRKPGLSFICECKKASPSKGLIAEDFPYLQIAREYEAAGADAGGDGPGPGIGSAEGGLRFGKGPAEAGAVVHL